jgi:hypothetical protein
MNIYIPYTYLIGWSKEDKFYYGRRTAKNCHPNDFWVKYFTSSDEVSNFRIEKGEPDIIQIRKTFPNNPNACKLWECKFLEKVNAQENTKFLNKRNGDIAWDTTGKIPWNMGIKTSPLNHPRSISYIIKCPQGNIFLVTGKLTEFCSKYRFNPKTLKEGKIPNWSIEKANINEYDIKTPIMIFKNNAWETYQITYQPKRKNDFGKTLTGKHAVKDTIPCINIEGKNKRISKNQYYSQTGNQKTWEWVFNNSNEGKSRRLKQ